MNSTGGLAGPRGSIRWPLTRRWVFPALSWLALAPALAQDNPMPRPPLLERDVQFWIRVYTQIDTNAGFLHDQYNLGVVYDTLHFAPNTTPAERERQVDQAREHYGGALRRIADAADAPLSAEDQRIKELWGAEATPARLRSAIEDIRFQLGQADRFRAGLIRSGAWETHIAETLANLGLPAELAVLPHVESSFNPAAYSKVGAAGLWQFMRSTGRRYMRIDSAVDDRLDPFRSTEAAAQLLAYNYRVLGTWPLALTAYNHGPDPRGVGRAAARAEGLPVATAARRNVLDAGAPGTTPQPRRDVRRTERPAPISGAGRRYARPGRRALRSVGRYARTDESPAGERALARRPDDRRARSGRGHGRIDRGTDSRGPCSTGSRGPCSTGSDSPRGTRSGACGSRACAGSDAFRACGRCGGCAPCTGFHDQRRAGITRRRGLRRSRATRERRGCGRRGCREVAHGLRRHAAGVGGAGRGDRSCARAGARRRAERRSHRLQRRARRQHSRDGGRDARALRRLARREHGARA